MFRHAALLSLLIIISGLSLVLREGRDHTRSLSSHAALKRPLSLLFAATLAAGALLFYLFAFEWLIPTLGLNTFFGTVMIAAAVCALVAAVVPDSGGTKSIIHGIGAWTMAVLMLVLVIILLASPVVGVTAKFVLAVLASYMVLDWFLFVFVKRSHKLFLIFQSTYVLCFYIAMLAVAYL